MDLHFQSTITPPFAFKDGRRNQGWCGKRKNWRANIRTRLMIPWRTCLATHKTVLSGEPCQPLHYPAPLMTSKGQIPVKGVNKLMRISYKLFVVKGNCVHNLECDQRLAATSRCISENRMFWSLRLGSHDHISPMGRTGMPTTLVLWYEDFSNWHQPA